MSEPRSFYSYWLSVTGSEEDRKAVNELLKEKKILEVLSPSADTEPYSQYQVREEWGSVLEWNQDNIDAAFHAIAVAVPGAILELEGCNEDDKITRFQKRFHGDLFQQTHTVTTMPPLREGGDIPFDRRHELSQNSPPKKMFMLCEEFENDDIPRSFTILAVSEDKEALRQLLRAKVGKDEYGFIADYGIDEDRADYFLSNNDDNRFVEYYIVEEDVLSREKALALLQTDPYLPKVSVPENLWVLLQRTIEDVAEDKLYGKVNADKTAYVVMKDPKFLSLLKNAYWAGCESIGAHNVNRARDDCYFFLCEKLDENPEYFTEIGAVLKYHLPENLKDMVIDCIYDISKTFHLSVTDVEAQAERYMRSSSFREMISGISHGLTQMEPGTPEFLKATDGCMAHVKVCICKEYPEQVQAHAKTVRLTDLIRNAENRTGSHDKAGGTSPDLGPER